MSYRIEHIEFYLRETNPARFPSALGKAARNGQAGRRVTSPLCHVRMVVTQSGGATSFGCSADRLSVRWLDKRPGRDTGPKRRELVTLIHQARELYLARPEFETPFEQWSICHPQIMKAGRAADQEHLSSSFASALLERAMLDAVCRLANKSMFEMLREDELGFRPGRIHTELGGIEFPRVLGRRPVTAINIRHTVGLFDPLTDEDWPRENRLNDGLPETLHDYIDRQGIRFFKVKISGDVDADLHRLSRIWEILPLDRQPYVTLDANEAFDDPEAFVAFVKRLEQENLGLFQHILYIEQPLPRHLALRRETAQWIRKVGRMKPVIIDESDATVDACRRALDVGYAGTSHKNCKGVFKSLTNLALAAHFADTGREILLSGEDLQNLPVVPLQQDFASVGILGLEHCERNGHHYNFGLSMLSEKDKQRATRRHPDLYEQRGDEWFLRIREGKVRCASLHGPGFGVLDEPDWESMQDLDKWIEQRHPG